MVLNFSVKDPAEINRADVSLWDKEDTPFFFIIFSNSIIKKGLPNDDIPFRYHLISPDFFNLTIEP